MLPTICISFGGTHIEIGYLYEGGGYISSGHLNWREKLMEGALSYNAAALFRLTVQSLHQLMSVANIGSTTGYNLGISFPGPNTGGQWFSNNLTDDFRAGVQVEQHLIREMQEAGLRLPSAVVVTLDAQADAGAELYHPAGLLQDNMAGEGACVINVATGIAAGFICTRPRSSNSFFVARTEEEFRQLTRGEFDGGAGQLGRHLFVRTDRKTWKYKYAPAGQLPRRSPGRRLTDYLSGPAIAARVALRIATLGEEFPSDPTTATCVSLAREALEDRNEFDCLDDLTRLMRFSAAPVVRSLLAALSTKAEDSEAKRAMVANFQEEIADDWAGALRAWQEVDVWRAVNRNIVFSGGVGQNLFRDEDVAFRNRILCGLLAGTRISRSTLQDGCERATWYFHKEIFA